MFPIPLKSWGWLKLLSVVFLRFCDLAATRDCGSFGCEQNGIHRFPGHLHILRVAH
jgi:hypothetical protein